MDQQTVDRLRERLETERGEVRRQLDDLGARRDAEGIEDPELDEGFADAGQGRRRAVSLLTLVRSLRDTLRDVEQALDHMDAGTYGVCERSASRSPTSSSRPCPQPATALPTSASRPQ